MKNEDFKKVISGIEEKLGKENSSVVADDLANLISDNISMNKLVDEKNATIKEKEELNQKLVMANSSLLQQVGVPEETTKRKNSSSNDSEDEEEKISWSDCFDKKRKLLEINFILKKGMKNYVAKRFKKFIKQNKTNFNNNLSSIYSNIGR